MDPLGRASFPALGTDAVVLSAAPDRLGVALDEVRAEVAAIDRACSRFRDDSDLSRANARAGHPVAVDDLLLEAVEVARRAARLTDGLVDPTVGDVVRVLGYDRDFAAVARSGPPVARVERVPGWRRIDVDRARGTLTVPRGASLDLGATAKALAADRAAVRASAAAGCGVPREPRWRPERGRCGAPDRMARAGHRLAGQPHRCRGQTVRITDGGLATSSTTVRRWRRGEADVHHIVDPTTGGRAEVVWRTVSVAAADCVDANVAPRPPSCVATTHPGGSSRSACRRGSCTPTATWCTSTPGRGTRRHDGRDPGRGEPAEGALVPTRGAGVVTLLLLTISLLLGVVTSVGWSWARLPRFVVVALHRNVSLLVLVFVGLHVSTMVLDGFVPIRWIDAVVPFIGAYHPLEMGLGALAFDLLLAVLVTERAAGPPVVRDVAAGALARLRVLADRHGARLPHRHRPT